MVSYTIFYYFISIKVNYFDIESNYCFKPNNNFEMSCGLLLYFCLFGYNQKTILIFSNMKALFYLFLMLNLVSKKS